MKMAFHRRNTIGVNIIAELKPAFENRRTHVIQFFTNEKNIIYHSHVTKF